MNAFGLPDLDEDVIDVAHTERLVDDWIERLQALRSQVAGWLAADFPSLRLVDRAPVPMHQGPMRRAGLAPRDMPAFEVVGVETRIMRFLPKGLWVIGANGRVDIISRLAAPQLVDRSEPLAPETNWQIYDSRLGIRSVPWTMAYFGGLVREVLA
jgi:hypothetical protein